MRATSPLSGTGGYPSHIYCKLYYDTNGLLCPNSFKALAMPPANIGGHYCKTGGEFPPRIATAETPWATSATWPDVLGQFTVELKNLQPNCNFDIVPSGFSEGPRILAGIVAGVLDNGRGIAIPIVFDIDPQRVGCTYQAACQPTWSWDLSELVDNCVNTPVYPP